MKKRFSPSRKSMQLGVCLAALLSAACTPQDSGQTLPAEKEYRLGVGDKLRVIVYGNNDLSGDFSVDSSGNLSLPLINSVQASNLTLRELEDHITDELSPEYLKDPSVSVEVLQYRDVYVLGEVRNPGNFPYIPGMNGLQAVAVAGGHTYRAEEDKIEINRQVKDKLEIYETSIKTPIKPGDVIIVNRRLF